MPFIGHARTRPPSRSSIGLSGSRSTAMTFAHAGILSDRAGRENLPGEEPDEAMLARSRVRAWNALYNAKSARMSQDAAASPRSSPASHELEQPASTASAIAADDQGGPPDRGLEGTSPGSDPSRYAQSKWALLAATVALSVAYAPNFRDLLSVWEADPNYSHGYLIIPIAACHPLAAPVG